jgi:hypothetical protein
LKNKFLKVQIHPTVLIFDVLPEFEVEIDQKHDFDVFLEKLKKSKNLCENPLKFSAFFYVTGPN